MRHAGRYADVEFGRLQARDLLQHLWTGAISNSPVDIVQGSKSVEVRPVGISKVRPVNCAHASSHASSCDHFHSELVEVCEQAGNISAMALAEIACCTTMG